MLSELTAAANNVQDSESLLDCLQYQSSAMELEKIREWDNKPQRKIEGMEHALSGWGGTEYRLCILILR